MADQEVENDKGCGASLEQVVKKGPFDKVTHKQASSGYLRLDLLRQKQDPRVRSWLWLSASDRRPWWREGVRSMGSERLEGTSSGRAWPAEQGLWMVFKVWWKATATF